MKISPTFRSAAMLMGVLYILLFILDEMIYVGHYGSNSIHQILFLVNDVPYMIMLFYLLATLYSLGENSFTKSAFYIFIFVKLFYVIMLHALPLSPLTRRNITTIVAILIAGSEIYLFITCTFINNKTMLVPYIIFAFVELAAFCTFFGNMLFIGYIMHQYELANKINKYASILGTVPQIAAMYVIYKTGELLKTTAPLAGN